MDASSSAAAEPGPFGSTGMEEEGELDYEEEIDDGGKPPPPPIENAEEKEKDEEMGAAEEGECDGEVKSDLEDGELEDDVRLF